LGARRRGQRLVRLGRRATAGAAPVADLSRTNCINVRWSPVGRPCTAPRLNLSGIDPVAAGRAMPRIARTAPIPDRTRSIARTTAIPDRTARRARLRRGLGGRPQIAAIERIGWRGP
jgi:hypothetical protein